jgi:hypothetical protein
VVATDSASTVVARALTNASGVFVLTRLPPGDYRLAFELFGYASHQSDVVRLRQGEDVSLLMRMSTSPLRVERLEVTARRRSTARHEASYEGLYARIELNPHRVGPNRIVVKGDWEMDPALSVSDVLRSHFRAGTRGACVYWNGFLLHPDMAEEMANTTSPDELEALEVYRDYLMAPSNMSGPPYGKLQTRCGAVIAMWPLRPDLPGRRDNGR